MERIARVYVNQVEVGSLPTDQYNSIAKEARKDVRVWISQGMNVFMATFRFVVDSLRLAPWACFLLSVLLLATSPDLLTHFFTVMATATPAEATKLYGLAVFSGSVMAIFSNLVGIAFGWQSPYGYVNEVDRVINQKVRQILEVPAVGDMTIVCVEIDG